MQPQAERQLHRLPVSPSGFMFLWPNLVSVPGTSRGHLPFLPEEGVLLVQRDGNERAKSRWPPEWLFFFFLSFSSPWIVSRRRPPALLRHLRTPSCPHTVPRQGKRKNLKAELGLLPLPWSALAPLSKLAKPMDVISVISKRTLPEGLSRRKTSAASFCL